MPLKRKWVVLKPPRESSGFVTSDHPVCLMFSDPARRGKFYGPGHGPSEAGRCKGADEAP